jgi:nascent polypeptide-associated complex subunit alpha
MNSQAQLSAAQQLASSGGGGVASLDDSGIGGDVDDDDDIPDLEAPGGDEPVDETGVESKDIDLVMAQVCLWCLVCYLLHHTLFRWVAHAQKRWRS